MNNNLLANMKNREKQVKTQKMLNFLDGLHRKYKVLSKLTQKQLSDFQNEVIFLLVDQNQNVDPNAYRQVLQNIGIDAFVLDVLAKCINRSPFSNQYQLKKNINSIAEDLEKQTKQLTKKSKILQRKETEFNRTENSLKTRIKQYAQQIQRQAFDKLIAKQQQMKKNINNLLNNLKLKQKILTQRRDQINNKLAQLCLKQKNLVVQQRKLDQGKQINKLGQAAYQNLTENTQINNESKVPSQVSPQVTKSMGTGSKQFKQLSKKFEDIKNQYEKLKKKNKTTQMAYNKIKTDLSEKDRYAANLLQKIQDVTQMYEKQKIKQAQRLKHKEIEQEVKVVKEIQQAPVKKNSIQVQNMTKKISTKSQPTKNMRENMQKDEFLIANNVKKNMLNNVNHQQNHQILQIFQMLQISHIENTQHDIWKPVDRLHSIEVAQQYKSVTIYQSKQVKYGRQINNQKNIKLPTDKNIIKNGALQQEQKSYEVSSIPKIRDLTIIDQDQKKLIESSLEEKSYSKINAFNKYFQIKKQPNCQNSKQQIEPLASQEQIKKGESCFYENQSQLDMSEINIPNFLSQKNTQQDLKSYCGQQKQESVTNILSKIQQSLQISSNLKSITSLLESNMLLKFASASSFQHTKQNLIRFFDILLSLIQQSCPMYYESLQYLSKPQFTELFQKSYLSYETNTEISESTTLLLSRILMVTQVQVKFIPEFINAIKLRVKIMKQKDQESQNDGQEFLKANINCLLSMVYV